MRTLGPLILCAALLGCGSDKRCEQTLSQVRVLADILRERVGDEGWFNRYDGVAPQDAWGHDLTVRYLRDGHRETVEVRSVGPDGLPFTSDDLAAAHSLTNRETQLQRREEGTASLTKGLARGLVQGTREGLKK